MKKSGTSYRNQWIESYILEKWTIKDQVKCSRKSYHRIFWIGSFWNSSKIGSIWIKLNINPIFAELDQTFPSFYDHIWIWNSGHWHHLAKLHIMEFQELNCGTSRWLDGILKFGSFCWHLALWHLAICLIKHSFFYLIWSFELLRRDPMEFGSTLRDYN